jgi:hypothetical protein
MNYYVADLLAVVLIALIVEFGPRLEGARQAQRRNAGQSRNRPRGTKSADTDDLQEIWRIARHLITGTLLCAVILSGWLLVIEDSLPSSAAAGH